MGSPRAPATASLSGVEALKQAAAQAAAELVLDGQKVGLGTGTTVAHLLPALAARRLDIRCVATSPATEQAARALGLEMAELDELSPLDIAIDGADQIDPEGWLVKGGGGAHTREKIVATAANRFVAIASAEKAVPKLGPPIPLELPALRRPHHPGRTGPGQAARGACKPRGQSDRRLLRSRRGSTCAGRSPVGHTGSCRSRPVRPRAGR